MGEERGAEIVDKIWFFGKKPAAFFQDWQCRDLTISDGAESRHALMPLATLATKCSACPSSSSCLALHHSFVWS